MQFLILGLALLVLVLIVGRAFTRANPKILAKDLRKVGGYAALLLSIVLAATGRVVLGIMVGFFGFSLLGWSLPWQGPGSGTKSRGQRSSVRTGMLEMTLDHDTGEMDGRVFRGKFAGRELSDLSGLELRQLIAEAWEQDVQTAQLLEAFAERAGHSSGGRRQSGRGPSAAGAMTIDEAYAVLGLQPGASREDIQQAHRALMKKYHPDQGGTTYLASKINEAKDILIQHVP